MPANPSQSKVGKAQQAKQKHDAKVTAKAKELNKRVTKVKLLTGELLIEKLRAENKDLKEKLKNKGSIIPTRKRRTTILS